MRLSRRDLLVGAAAARALLSPKERVDRVLRGQDVDRTPFTFWHHFLDENQSGEKHAEATLAFHRRYRTDLVKVMSDYPFPKPAGNWYELKVIEKPFPRQLRALELIRDGLQGRVYFLETIFNPWNVAEKLSSREEVLRLKNENPKALLSALEVIAESQASHAKDAVAAGAAGIFLAIANAQDGVQSREEYAKFSQPFDRMILDAVSGAPLNTLHLHGDKVHLDFFVKGWPAAAINYSASETRVSAGAMRKQYPGVLMAGLDEVNFRKLGPAALRREWKQSRAEAGRKFILVPGCSVPNDSTATELSRVPAMLGA